ncbi:GntR family transcriptional regulator [Streptomyces sp. MST-110588]|uniref:TetR/AcrR family transcriptional regulator C-terminal domain-containing protein n=1 Tax=Streptomyces sp. MST-110588 TaxID=2833628 RepID=UPI001F5D139E|nr:GntR family transcriptional regulator [Streptomyces sp. MST-110588]UNO42232.1 GntR family transcriptional regulator [Streptomyces sp. MST-110588]
MDRSEPPPYLRIVAEIRRRITDGELGAGDRVPSTRGITQEWGVAMATATKVLATLRQEGLVRAVPGVGTVVAAPGPAHRAPAGALPPHERRHRDRGRNHDRRRDQDRDEGGSGLSRERVVRAAMAVADAEGLRALSMRRVAAEFGVSSMALYRHVANKHELLFAMAEAAFGEPELPDPAPRDWRGRMEAGARLQWELYHRHPWLAPYLSMTRPTPMPNAMALIEWTMARTAIPDPVTKLHVALTLINHVRGTAVSLEDELENEQETGLSRGQWMDAMEPMYERIIASGSYPMYAQVEVAGGEESLTLDSIFEFGLARLLDGIGPLVAEEPEEAAGPAEPEEAAGPEEAAEAAGPAEAAHQER